MPRPKRSKVAPSTPTNSKVRVTQPAPVASTVQKQQKIFSPEFSGRVTNGSDDSDGLVVLRKTNGSKRTLAAETYTMSGALAPEDIGESRLKPPSGQTRAALSRIVRDADHEKSKQEKARKIAEANPGAEPDQIPSSIPTNTAHSRRPSTALGQFSARESIQAISGMRAQETPRLHSLSILGGATFKKRPRQPSLLQMIQPRNNAPQDDSDDNDMYDFLPDDESTPLIKSLPQTNAQSKSSSSQQMSGSRKRKMKSPEIQVPASQSFGIRSSPSVALSESEPQQTISEDDDQPEPTLPPLRSTQTPQPEIFSDTLAPPRSSSSTPEPEARGTCREPTKAPSKTKVRPVKSHRKQLTSARSHFSSTSTQTSPVHLTKPKPLTTATLQNLLPRRRARAKPKGDYDIPSSSDVELDTTALGEDEDELSFHATGKMRRKKQSMGIVAQKRAAKGKEAGTGSKGKKVSKTYTRKSINASGDENESGSGSDVDEIDQRGARGRSKTPGLDGKVKAEMKRLADKFREVDQYTLDFEEMTGSSSQMKDAR
ncbi:hypothetical protein N7G274_001106 [Stereocaulon virgatum]|uniref:Uncharacterized protein n=1 Tax=Stereocaulon virgatum TaxID=373712 RepID=A0ABR4AQN1_9LECA